VHSYIIAREAETNSVSRTSLERVDSTICASASIIELTSWANTGASSVINIRSYAYTCRMSWVRLLVGSRVTSSARGASSRETNLSAAAKEARGRGAEIKVGGVTNALRDFIRCQEVPNIVSSTRARKSKSCIVVVVIVIP
jgi:hypothetical protein